MHRVLAGYVERGELPGLVSLVSRHGETHVDAIGTQALDSGQAMQRDTIFRIASMTKPIVGVAAMILVEECRLRLDEPIDVWLPELANRRVLKRLDGALDDTVPARRPIHTRDLLTCRMGLGYAMDLPSDAPMQKALATLSLLQGPPHPRSLPEPDPWLRQLATLPLMHQPGEVWLYDLGLDVLGVLIARAAGQPLPVFLAERIFEPLGMKDTGFHVPPEKVDRLSGCYQTAQAPGGLEVYDDPRESEWSRPPAFPSGSGGLVSTVDDYLAFCRMMLDRGSCPNGRERILARPSVELMTRDHLTAEQRAAGFPIVDPGWGWGLGLGVLIQPDDLSSMPGRFGWQGGLGTTAYSDPHEDLIGVLMTPRLMDSPESPRHFTDFWTLAYQAIDD